MSEYSAASSWSGYQYQGKASIYIVIKMINELLNIEEDMANYVIEIEHREDFAIKKLNEYQSFHQVKAKLSDKYINNYLEAMVKLYAEKIQYPNASLFLHTAVEVSNWALDNYRKNISEKVQALEERKIKIEQSNNINKKSLQEIENSIKKWNDMLSNEEIFNSIELYQYGPNKYCSLDEIEKLIIEEIKKYFNKTSQVHKLEEIDIIFNNFIGFFDEYIKKRHLKEVDKEIPFRKIKDILDNDQLLERGKKYHLFVIKNIYTGRLFNDFCMDICKPSEENDCTDCELLDVLEYINVLELDDFERLIIKLNPHRGDNISEDTRHKFISEEGVHFFYDTIVNLITDKIKFDNNSIFYKSGNLTYMPTTIETIRSRRKKAYQEAYIKYIKNNGILIKELYEISVLITEDMNIDNIFDTINSVEEVEEVKRQEDDKYRDKQHMRNIISLRAIEKVKGELNK